jgi:hypothetical protein
MTRWDPELTPCDHARKWRLGDEVWYGTTLYDVVKVTETRVELKRHEPLTFRSLPPGIEFETEST